MRRLILTIVVLGVLAEVHALADWTQFRGPAGDGRAEVTNLPTEWGGFLSQPAWQTPLPGTGWSSPIVIGDRIWLTAAEETALNESSRAAKLAQLSVPEQDFQAHASVTFLALELDATDGKLLRRIELFTKENPPPIHVSNTYASPTPVTEGKYLYCHFGSLGTVSLDVKSGEIKWKQQFKFDELTGAGNSPVLSEGLLFLACDGADDQFVVALNSLNGEIVWRKNRPPIDALDGKHRRAFSTPLVIECQGRKQLVATGAQWLVSYAPANGDELWRVNFGTGHATVPRPVFQDGVVFVCTGYPDHQLWAVRADGTGDVTDTHVIWKHSKQAPEISSPVITGDEIYLVSAIGVATCLDLKSGETRWQHRLGGNYTASPLAADDKIYFSSINGVTTVIRPARQYEELARNELFGQTQASLAIANNSLLIRADSALYCIRAREPSN